MFTPAHPDHVTITLRTWAEATTFSIPDPGGGLTRGMREGTTVTRLLACGIRERRGSELKDEVTINSLAIISLFSIKFR